MSINVTRAIGLNQLICIAGLLFCVVYGCTDALAGQSEEPAALHVSGWKIQTSIYTRHFDPQPEHNNDQNLLGVEAMLSNDWLIGAAVFDNSYSQASQMAFAGKEWGIGGSEYWYFKFVGGLVHGYKEPYEDKIPLNGLGVAPFIMPTLGFRYRFMVGEANLGGLAVVTFTAGIRF